MEVVKVGSTPRHPGGLNTSNNSFRSRDLTWQYYMWLDLRKPGFHAHNDRPHISLSLDGCTIRLSFHASLSAKGFTVCFYWGLFHGPVDVLVCSVVHQTAMVGQNRKITGWEWPHDSTVILAIDLATFYGIFGTIGPQWDPSASLKGFCNAEAIPNPHPPPL